MSRDDLLLGSGQVLDPNAVNELFENVVYGDGLPLPEDDQGARHRRQEAERRRLEMEERARDNAIRRAKNEQNRQFFDNLILSGPDRPALPPTSVTSSIKSNQHNRSDRFRIPFTAMDRSRVPRKTRQQWLDKFCTVAESTFSGAMSNVDPDLILSLEQSVYQTAKTATSYIGAWMNRIHAMKSATSLSDFLSPNLKQAVAVEPRDSADLVPEQNEMQDNQIEAISASLPVQTDSCENPSQFTTDAPLLTENSMSADVVALSSLSVVTETVKSGKATLLGKALPFSLFGSDNEDEELQIRDDPMEVQQLSVTEVSHRDEDNFEGKTTTGGAQELCLRSESMSSEINGITPDPVFLGPASDSPPSNGAAEQSKEPLKSDECADVPSNLVDNEHSQPLSSYPEKTETKDIVSPKLPLLKKTLPQKRNHSAAINAHSGSGKKQKIFDPECRTFIQDVVAAHLRLRFGRDLPGKTIVAVQARVVDKILSNPKWTLQRLRKHKRDIDDFAERYAEKFRLNDSKVSVQKSKALSSS